MSLLAYPPSPAPSSPCPRSPLHSPPVPLHRPLLAPLHLDTPISQRTRGFSYQLSPPHTVYSPPRRTLSADVALLEQHRHHGEDESGELSRIEEWRTGVPVGGQEEHNEDENDEGASFFPPPFSLPLPPLTSLPPVVGPPVDDPQDEHFVALAALHDPSLFSPSSLPPPSRPSQLHFADEEEEEDEREPDSPSALEVDFGRGRRAREDGERRKREFSLARSTRSSVGMSRKMIPGGFKAGASVEVQAKDVSSPPLHRSSPPQGPLSSPPPLKQTPSSQSKHTRGGSAASDQLLRLHSTSPVTHHSSSPTSPLSRPQRPHFKRRYSSIVTATPHDENEGPLSPTPLARSNSHHNSIPAPHHCASVAALSKYLHQGRRSSLPAPHHASPIEPNAPPLPSPQTIAVHRRDHPSPHPSSTLDLRHLAFSASHLAHSFSEHLPTLPSLSIPHHLNLHFHTAPSPSPRYPSPVPTPTPALPSASSSTGSILWSSVKALNIRFRPGGSSEAAASSLGVNHLVLGLQDLAAGGSRSWDPRLLDSEGDEGEEADGKGEKGGEEANWPTVSTAIGPPRVEVVYEGGGRRTCDVAGLSVEEILRALLAPPT
ncbi:hypothetical protein JCM8547_002560 [Rhodosporidiobolus lusitaniae]